jgi:hypothetical protein
VLQKISSVLLATTLIAGCSDIAGPEPVALQFQGGITTTGVPAVTVSESPRGFIRVVGGYTDSACGPIGAQVTRDRSTIRLEIRPHSSGCDLIRVGYAYEATMIGLAAGDYLVRVFHSPSAGAPQLAIESQITVH